MSLDPNTRPSIIDDRERWDHFHHRWLAHADVYKASDEDLAWIWPGREPESCAEELVAGGVSAVIVTRGPEGLAVITADGAVPVPAPLITVVDTVGAGDTIMAAVLVSLWERAQGSGQPLTARLGLDEWAVAGRRVVRRGRHHLLTSRRRSAPPSSAAWD